MKKTKFCLGLLGIAVLMISACEKQENKVEATPKVEETQKTAEQNVKKEAALLEENKEKTSVVDHKSEAIEQEKMVEAEKTVEMTTQQKTQEAQVSKVSPAPAKIKQKNDPNTEKRKILQILEQQYQQVRCTSEGEKLSSESFCHQEEYRLLNEIDRLKKKLR
ncbi:TPA: hypothetical protein ACPI87_001684 [Haemophilus influenzae]|uniref:Uncharacterized protein n=1 Tax=Haemophilus influenzae TaxID=727 RepID=A0A2S9RSC9_HAEIF|nr:hypothetical protein [Haemophilus influenzae]AWP53586.1 hypothetical protein DLJ98_01865 [Haemophilus influenzae]PRI38454.1 hypothetical protein BVZ56_00615 [Haemophilus influenzae]PRI46978.1 hypothetical protein BVZ70_00285 [Haemophilus influenzae]PRJ58634.1 hypothetical protein BV094_01852 [Haemophilus influenzae]PRJ59007.1 hypothetical protein BV097_01253 [Haemophilus influenzae]